MHLHVRYNINQQMQIRNTHILIHLNCECGSYESQPINSRAEEYKYLI